MGLADQNSARIDNKTLRWQVKLLYLFEKDVFIYGTPGGQKQHSVGIEDTSRHVSQGYFLTIYPNRVTRIWSTTSNDAGCIELHSRQGDDLPLSLRTVLSAYNDCAAHLVIVSSESLFALQVEPSLVGQLYPRFLAMGSL